MTITLNSLLQKHEAGPSKESAFALGQVYEQMREYGKAAEYFTCARNLHPESRNSWIRCGDVLAQAGRLAEAVEHYRQALRLGYGDADTHFKLGSVYVENGLAEPATEHLVRSLALNPQQSRAWDALTQLHANGNSPDALLDSLRSFAKGKEDEDAFLNGVAWGLSRLGRYEESRALFLRHLRRRPFDTEILMRLAEVEDCRADMAAARKVLERALDAAPGSMRHVVFTSYLHHLARTGDLEGARQAGRRRRRSRDGYQMSAPGREETDYREWSGEPVTHKTVLMPLWRTGIGHGDAVQSGRFARQMKKMGATVIVECHRVLAPLLSRLDGADFALTPYSELPPIDYCVHAGIACLLADSWSDAETVPYVHPSTADVASWREQLGKNGCLKVGVNWSGTQQWRRDKNRYRSMPLAELAPLAALPEVELYSLQFDASSEETTKAGFPVHNLPIGDFLDTAAAVQALDVIVTVDSAMAHVAGALGKTCLVLLPYVSEWRWMIGRTDSPLYPSLVLCRQKRPGEWAGPVAEAAAKLVEHLPGGCNAHARRFAGMIPHSRNFS